MQPNYLPYADINLLPHYEWQQINDVFHELQTAFEIEFNFPQGGCQQRAQIMSMLLQKKFTIAHAKIWLFAPAALYLNDDRMLFASDTKRLSEGNMFEWSYHVAPIVRVQLNDEIHSMVIDPSISKDAPMYLKDWFAAIGNSTTGQFSFLWPDKYFFNSSYLTNNRNEVTMIFDGTFFDFENPAKDNLIVEKGLAIHDMVNAIYQSYILPLIHNNNPADAVLLSDMKAIFGNATALDMLFSQNISAYTINTSQRYVHTQYNQIFMEAKNIFNTRLSHWTHFINTLL
jgi:hypothetical protein